MLKVSIITVTYNSKDYIKNCIESVITQNYQNIEYIVIDGNSTDETIAIVNKYKNHIDVIISEPDHGIYDAINKGINIATGDIVGILNSDDFFADNTVVSRIADSFITYSSEIVFADINFVKRENIAVVVRKYKSWYFRPFMFRFGFMPAHPTFYTRRENYLNYGLYRTDFKIAADFELLLRFLKVHSLSYSYIQDTWVIMRNGGVSTSGLSSFRIKNREIMKACELNGISTHISLIYFRYLIKIFSFTRFSS